MFKPKPIIFIALIFILGSVAVLFIQKNRIQDTNSDAILPEVPVVSAVSTTSINSSDGKETLTLETKTDKDITTYSFFVNNYPIFTKTLTNKNAFTMPFNSFSPDNKYVFIKENNNNENNFYVLNLKNQDKIINITDLFNQKLLNYKLEDVTGWAAPNLIIVNAKTNSNEQQLVSFWFDIMSQSFIQLSTKFN